MAWITKMKPYFRCPLLHPDTRLTKDGCCRICMAQLNPACSKCPTFLQIANGETPTLPSGVNLITKEEFTKLKAQHIIPPHLGKKRHLPFLCTVSRVTKYPFRELDVGEVWTGPYIRAKQIRASVNRIKLLQGKRFETKKEGESLIVRRTK